VREIATEFSTDCLTGDRPLWAKAVIAYVSKLSGPD